MISYTKRNTGSIRDGEQISLIKSFRMRMHIGKNKNENDVSIPNTIIRCNEVENNTYVCVNCTCRYQHEKGDMFSRVKHNS